MSLSIQPLSRTSWNLEVAGTRLLDHMETCASIIYSLCATRRDSIVSRGGEKRGGWGRDKKERNTHDKTKKKSWRKRGRKKYFSSRENTVISLVRRSALRKGRGVTELYESTPVLSLSLRIPSPSIILLLRSSTTQTPSLPSRGSSLLLPPSLPFSLSLSIFSFIPLFLHPRFWLSPLSCPSSSTPCVSSPLFASPFFYPLNAAQSSPPVGPQCRSNPLREHISPWPPYQSLLTWFLNQYPLFLAPKGFSCPSFPPCHLHPLLDTFIHG